MGSDEQEGLRGTPQVGPGRTICMFLGIDIGTSGVKAVVLSSDGVIAEVLTGEELSRIGHAALVIRSVWILASVL